MANKAVDIILRAKDLASGVMTKLNTRIKSIGKTSGNAAEGTNRLSGSVRGLTSRIGAFIGATAGFLAVKGLFEGVINTGAKFETLNTQLAAVTGSAAAGEEAFAWIKEFTKETPFQLDQVSESFVKLKAFGLDPMDGTMQKLVDTASKLGGGQEKLNGIILAVGQAWAKQKLQAEETLQLVERGVPVYDLLSKALGKTTAEIQEMSQKGELGRDAIKALIDAMGDDSIGAAAAEMKNFRGIVSNLKDTFVEFLAEVSDQGVLDYLKDQLSGLSDTMKQMRADGSLQELAKDISNFMIKAAEATKAVVGTIIKFSSELKLLVTVFISVKIGQLAVGMLILSANMLKAVASAKLLKTALLSTGFGAIALAIGFVAEKLSGLNDITLQTVALNRQTQKNREKEIQIWADLSDRIGIQIKNEQDLNKAKKDGLIIFDEQTKQYERVTAETQKAVDAGDDYTNMLKSFNAELANNADQTRAALTATQEFRQVIKQMEKDTDGLAGALSDLTSEQFVKFSEQANGFADSPFSNEIEKSNVQVAILAESLDRANVDIGLFETGISSAGAEAISGFSNITNAAETSARQIGISLDSTLTAVRTQQGFKSLREQVVKLGSDGKLMGVDLANALQKVDEAAKAANESLADITSSVNSASTIEELNAVGVAAHEAMDAGKITAQEYLDVMTDVETKLADVNDKLQQQKQSQKELNDEGANSDTEDRLESENQQRSQALDLTERQTTALIKAAAAFEDVANNNKTTDGYFRYLEDVEQLKQKLEQASESAEQFADKILEVADSGKASEQQMAGYVRELESAISSGEELDDQALSKLQSALSAAKSKMEALKNETKGAASEVAGLEAELASLNGNTEKVQQLEFQQRRLDLEEKIAQAQADGNNEAVKSFKQSLTLLSQINQKKQANIKADKQERTAQKSQVTPQARTERTVKLQFQSPQGRVVNATVAENDADSLIDVLKQSGASTR